jgi:hypothetical protein
MIFAMDYGVTLKVGASPGVSYAQSEQVAPVWHTSDTPTTPDTVGLSLAVANVTTSAVRAYALC